MFKKLAAEALGISDIGVIVGPADYNKVDADDYLFSEDGEQIFFLIKSKKDEYCFTNLALIHVDGDSAVSSKRSIKRYDYASHQVSKVSIETAGTLDMDVELKFDIDNIRFSIDIKKTYIEQLKDIYKALITIGKQQHRDAVCRDNALRTLDATASVHKLNLAPGEGGLVASYGQLLSALNTAMLETHTKRDFSDVFTKYIHN
ncbi:PH domain-containing protein [Massilia sp. IC2-477]|uniref:PH domain-containing protein n=1 Tax=unclassified Massilia TaxID=2609279 RepID=UPI001D12DBED|nr:MULTISPECIES: PH domain-containing protein [unclassified Massilia]MCC2954612.1 PH domain-containing protein [Massilia sp. IC2-477]MCC2972029.1 PH domain-containing protein [Massilia sp. IC2-476]